MSKKTTEMLMIDKERKNINFSVEELTNIIDGGKDETATRRRVDRIVLNDPMLKVPEVCHMNREERFSAGMKKTVYLYKKLLREEGWHPQSREMSYLHRTIGSDLCLGIHAAAFIPSLMSFGSDDQLAKWLPLALNLHIIGTYAQTELGHGTFLRGLETVAQYDKLTQEFVINCPKLSSMKWWPGDLGKSANHVLLMADLRIGATRHGMHAFIVQIRDLTTHQPLPGVTVGDIGNKLAFESTDNGFLYLQNVRIPRENMLCKHAEVAPDGTYTEKASSRMMYGSMVNLRVLLLQAEAVIPLAKVCTIATRYSSVRRQGLLNPAEPEVAVLDYVTQQHKLLPRLAVAYSTYFATEELYRIYRNFLERSDKRDISQLPELHALSAGMKASVTEQCVAAAEICRRACGGHGYSQASGVALFCNRMLASCTYEGENTVMHLQCARYLVKCIEQAQSSKLLGSVAYLNETDSTCPARTANDFKQINVLAKLLQQRLVPAVGRFELSAREGKEANLRVHLQMVLKEAVLQLRQRIRQGQPMHDAWNNASVYMLKAAKVHILQFIISTSAAKVSALSCSIPVKNVLSQLVALYALNIISDNSGDFLKTGLLNPTQCRCVDEAELDLLAELRVNAVGLVDAFDFSDESLLSCLGAYDGNAYERLFECAKRAPLNKTEVHEESYKYLRPFLLEGRDILEGKKKAKL